MIKIGNNNVIIPDYGVIIIGNNLNRLIPADNINKKRSFLII
jgi:hypothetical protein